MQWRTEEPTAVSAELWAAVPHYVAQPPCPKATLALVRRVEDILEPGQYVKYDVGNVSVLVVRQK